MTKYAPMSEFLAKQDASRIHLDFGTIEEILAVALPRSAHDYQAWWANDASHSQAKAWLEAGWQTENLNLSGGTVDFVRVRNVAGTSPHAPSMRPPLDPWGALAGTVTIHDEAALTSTSGEVWDAER